MTDDVKSKWMEIALEEANNSLRAGEVPVGCIFIYENEIIATGSNTVNETHNATRHAEMNCIDQVIKFSRDKNLNYQDVFKSVEVVVTVEPCIMCAAALHQLQIASITYGCANDRFGGCKSVLEVAPIYESKVDVIGGVRAEEAMNLLKQFYKGTNPNAPESKQKHNKRKNKEGID
ncbi:tRNA-specific adenosine deaminase 2 [Microplitis mediator]|uniref:tRNA-specific adenosine deaminase 2 n=1 Tax=Microplitis mediator TaxID=375433 RepID=UPI002556A82E|nr:tRNA-specific adenosine deaminase 2 [Microplitis mediator]